jgi:hypothetical protein
MFHVINAGLARLARRTASRLARDHELAAWHGWEARRTGWGRWVYRDPRFNQLAATRTTPAITASRTWAQAATADRIRTLGAVRHDPASGRGA